MRAKIGLATLLILGTFVAIFLFTTVFRASAPESTPRKEAEVIALTGGTVIDATGAEPIGDAVVLISEGRIIAVGPAGEIEIPSGAKTVDVGGCTVLPGFFNAHVHRAYDEAALQRWARGGVTTVRDLGGNADELVRFREEHPQTPQMARLVAAGPLITAIGGYPVAQWGGYNTALQVATVDEAVAGVADLLDRGAGIIKIALERGDIWQPADRFPVLTSEQARAIVVAAHGRGTVVSAHITSWVDVELALDAGVDDIAHMAGDSEIPDELIARVVEAGTVWVPTLELWHNANERLGAIAVANLRRFVEAGGTVALGTDFAGYRGYFDDGMPIREIRWMREAGMTPMQIIVAATANAARVSNIANQVGTLEAGKVADILVVRGDPLADLETLLDVRLVMREGVIIRE